MDIANFDGIRTDFLDRVQQAVYCIAATVDPKGRPRTRVLHVVWDVRNAPIGWVITWPKSPKAKHLANTPFVSLAYFSDPKKPIYAECVAAWVSDAAEQHRIWDWYKTVPPPMGFDPEPHYGTIANEYFGLLRLTPWRVELGALGQASQIWRPQ